MTDILVTRDILGAAHPRGATGLVNLYAAMPSLHVAWAAWCALPSSPLPTAGGATWPGSTWPATTLVVLASANHFLLDAAGGLALAGQGMARPQAAPSCPASRRKIPPACAPSGDAHPLEAFVACGEPDMHRQEG